MQLRALAALAVAGAVAGSASLATAQPKAADVSLTDEEYVAEEGAGSATITIRRVPDAEDAGGESIVLTTSNGSATAPDDFDAVEETVVFEPGQTEASVVVDLVDDSDNEGDETFTVSLSSPGGGAILGDPTSAVVVVFDNDTVDVQPACPPGSFPRGTFTDVDPASTHAEPIDCVAARGVAQGTSATTYAPTAPVNRGQAASFLRRVIDLTDIDLAEGADRFTDDEGNVHEANINALANAGILNGTGGSSYSPGNSVTRAQLAAFLVRTYEFIDGSELPDGDDAFDDDDGTTLEPEINSAAAVGFARGTGERQFSPSNPVQRDQTASFLNRLMDRLTGDGATPPLGGS